MDFREYASCSFTDACEKGSDDCLDNAGQESNHYAGSISMESQAKPNKFCAPWRPANLPGVSPGSQMVRGWCDQIKSWIEYNIHVEWTWDVCCFLQPHQAEASLGICYSQEVFSQS